MAALPRKVKAFRIIISHAENLAIKNIAEEKKKKSTTKWRVIIIDEKGKKKSTPVIANDLGNPHWDTEVDVKCYQKSQPVVLLVTDSEENHVGQVYIHPERDLDPVPESGMDPLGIWSRRCQELEPTKKNSYPQGRLYYWAWALAYVNETPSHPANSSNFLSLLRPKDLQHSRGSSFISNAGEESRPSITQSFEPGAGPSPSRLSSASELALSVSSSQAESKSARPSALIEAGGGSGSEKRRTTWKSSLLHLTHMNSNDSKKGKKDSSGGSEKGSTLPRPSKNKDIPTEEPFDVSIHGLGPGVDENALMGEQEFFYSSLPRQSATLHLATGVGSMFTGINAGASWMSEHMSDLGTPTTPGPFSEEKYELMGGQRPQLHISLHPTQGSLRGGYPVYIKCSEVALVPQMDDLLGVYVDSRPVDRDLVQWVDPHTLRIAAMPGMEQPCQCFVDVDTVPHGLQRCHSLFMFIMTQEEEDTSRTANLTSPRKDDVAVEPSPPPKPHLNKSATFHGAGSSTNPGVSGIGTYSSIKEEHEVSVSSRTTSHHELDDEMPPMPHREVRAASLIQSGINGNGKGGFQHRTTIPQLNPSMENGNGKTTVQPPPSTSSSHHVRNSSEGGTVWQSLPKWAVNVAGLAAGVTVKEVKVAPPPQPQPQSSSLVDTLTRELDHLRHENEMLNNSLRDMEVKLRQRDASIVQLSGDLLSLRNRLLMDNLIEYLERPAQDYC